MNQNKKSIQLSVENFQAIRKANLKFETGINIIMGSNSSGKSSLLRSVHALVLNPSYAKRYIRHGEDSTKVKLEIDNHSIEWIRTHNSVSYVINGQVNNKCGRDNIFSLLPEVKLVQDIENNKLLNMQTEHDLLFPFDRSATDMFKLFEDIFDVSDSSQIFQAIKKDENELNKSITSNKLKSKEIEKKLEDITNFNSSYSVTDIDLKKDSCENYLSVISNLNTDLKKLNNLDLEINSIQSIPKQQDFTNEIKTILFDNLSLQSDSEIVESNFKFLSQSQDINTILNFDLSILEKNQHQLSDYKKIQELNLFINSISNQPIKLFDLTVLNTLIDINILESILNKSKALLDIKLDIENFDLSLLNLVLDMKKDLLSIKTLSDEMLMIKKDVLELENLKLDLENKLSSVKICPLCNNHIKN